MVNKFEMYTFGGESICFEFQSIIVCNKKIKEDLLSGYIVLDAPKPYVIMTNDEFSDEEVEILEDASIADCLKLHDLKPAFGGVLV